MDKLAASRGSPCGHRLRRCSLRHPASAVGFRLWWNRDRPRN